MFRRIKLCSSSAQKPSRSKYTFGLMEYVDQIKYLGCATDLEENHQSETNERINAAASLQHVNDSIYRPNQLNKEDLRSKDAAQTCERTTIYIVE